MNEALEWLREENRRDREEKALEWLASEVERLREARRAEWESGYSDAQEWLKESLRSEAACQEEGSEESTEVEAVQPSFTSMEEVDRAIEQHQRIEKTMSETSQMEDETKEQKETTETLQGMEGPQTHLNEQMKKDSFVEEYSVKDSSPQEIPRDVLEESLAMLRESESVDVEAVVDAVDSLVCSTSEMESRVKVGDLGRTGIEKSRLREIRDILQDNKENVREELRERLEEDTRVGVVKEKLYVWTPNWNPNDMINGWRTQYFYMDTKDLLDLIKDTNSRLELDDSRTKSSKSFSNLIQQFTSDGTYKQFSIGEGQSRITGESLKFIRDVTGIETETLEKMIHRVAGANGHGGIENPKLPEGRKLEVLRARLIATAVSDCYVRPDGILEYYEENLERIERFKGETLRGFGDFFKEPRYIAQHRYYRLKISSPYGRALNEWGIPSGDRAILNYRLPRETVDWSEESVCAYLQDLIAEEGHVAEYKIRWNRSNVLHAGGKTDDYDLEPKISQEHAELIKGKRNEYAGEYAGENTLRWTKLKELRNSDNPKIAETAKELCRIVKESRNRLMDDEERLAKKLGIELVIRPEEVTYYEKSGRASVKWEARTKGMDAMIRWALLCPPNHPEKEVALKKWLSERKIERVRRIVDDLKLDGFEIRMEGF